jgi:23S rRNA (guanosine2251-2'-O)-methyltransferase
MSLSQEPLSTEWIWGKQPILEILRSHPHKIKQVFMPPSDQDPLREEIRALCRQFHIPLAFKERLWFNQKLTGSPHQSVIARMEKAQPFLTLEALLAGIKNLPGQPPVLLAIDHVQDPRNLGAMIRTAYCAGVGGVILPKKRACPVTGTVRKAAAGAMEHIPLVQVSNLVRTVESLKKEGFWSLSLEAGAAHSLYSLDLNLPLVVVIGGEGKGVSPLLQKKSDWVASIPMAGKLSSLNASVACAVVLYEIFRQHRKEIKPTHG